MSPLVTGFLLSRKLLSIIVCFRSFMKNGPRYWSQFSRIRWAIFFLLFEKVTITYCIVLEADYVECWASTMHGSSGSPRRKTDQVKLFIPEWAILKTWSSSVLKWVPIQPEWEQGMVCMEATKTTASMALGIALLPLEMVQKKLSIS